MPQLESLEWTNSESAVLGRTEPRLWTPPLRELTPDTSYGYDVIDFAEAIGWPLDDWQKWLVIHLGELLPDGRPRFRMVLALVARQNGKTLLCRILILYWMFIERIPLTLGISGDRTMAKRSWKSVIQMAESTDMLADELPAVHDRQTLSEEDFWNNHEVHYQFAAPNSSAGRSQTVWRLIMDELREHKVWDAYNVAVNAMNAVSEAQAIAITNQGEERAVVLDSLRDSAIEFIETGHGDSRLGIFEWSAPNGADVTDPEALAAANPSLNRGRLALDSVMGAALRAKRSGGIELASFKTEVLCQRVTLLNAAFEDEAWKACATSDPIDMADHRRSVALCLDVSLDATHATLVAAVHLEGKTHVEVIKRWQGRFATQEVRRDLPRLVGTIRPRVLGWFPGGPTAAIAASMARRSGADPWPPRGTKIEALQTETKAVCMGAVEQVNSGEVVHPDDPMLNEHIKQTEKLKNGDGFVYTRRGSKPIDGSYAFAGAVHLARTLPAPPGPLVVVRA